MAINPDKLLKDIQKIADTSTESFREKLNKNIHVVDISFGALKVSDPKLDEETYAQLIDAFSQEYRVRTSLKQTIDIIKDRSTVLGFSALVDDSAYGIFIVSKTYGALQTKIAGILKKISGTSSFTGIDELGKTITNIGHIPNSFIDSAKSPLSEKIKKILQRSPLSASKPVMQELLNLYNTHITDIEYQFSRENYDIKGLNKLLGSGTILVTLHSSYTNNEFSVIEKSIADRVKKYVSSEEFKNDLINTPGSNTILEDIEESLFAALSNIPYVSRHTKKHPSTLTSTTKGTAKVVQDTFPAIRNVPGQFYSLASLQTLINASLQHVISANMGDGGRKDILNYRTGRFAASAQVERLSQSREGMITAFYSYLKYPYATFSEGGAQGSPKTRDPKLLIAKSIREIAVTKIGNRLRAVLV